MLEQLEKSILSHIPDAEVHVSDPNQDGQHFQAIVVSASFLGLPLVKQHQKVLNALKQDFATHLHAMAVQTFTPDVWQQYQKSK